MAKKVFEVRETRIRIIEGYNIGVSILSGFNLVNLGEVVIQKNDYLNYY